MKVVPKNEWDDFSDVGNFAADKFVAESPDMPPVAITESIVSEPEKNDGFVCTVRIDDNHTGVTIGKSSVIGKRAYQQDAIITDDDYVYSERKIAVAILCGKEAKAKKEAGEDVKAFLAEKEEEYTETFANPYQAAQFGYIDDVIEPRNTRFRICRGLAQLATKRQSLPAKKHGCMPM